MLKKETIKKINELVFTKPRSIFEISKHIKVNWRTANRYVDKINKEEGTISTQVFRGGTPGALKVVYWNNIENIHTSGIQERLFKQIEMGRIKKDFSPSEIYQFVDSKKKKMVIQNRKQYYAKNNYKDYEDRLKSAERQVLLFSGNMSFSNLSDGKKNVKNVLEELAKRKISIKILTRIEWAGIENIKDVLAINDRVGHDSIEIRHCFQPLRSTVIDDKDLTFKEVLDPKDFSKGELKEKKYILYYIYDQDWIEWVKKIFWHLFRSSIDAKRRMEELNLIM